ncbi:hypothetical protein [Pseudochryseolinea flava]|uniref:Uncharacterized protein n=1 Tax=Pseudochryseolinea flava TaxID=2059302 RepID=A0A364Y0A1_9BACT|nr:hypothetical protein [Pseudochryseolinea flava]RAV99162.1 hypothetical protein DQQ10_19875 [Pseudochryseolinea flava]
MNKELNLDFSGGPKSWFDLWHTHVDWDGKGNKDWKTRTRYLEQILETFDQLKQKLQTYPHAFQLWIMIDENDSGEDCVYIHTKNPNADNFPIKVTPDNKNEIKDKELKQFVDSLNFERVRVETSDGDLYYLFDKGTGISLV